VLQFSTQPAITRWPLVIIDLTQDVDKAYCSRNCIENWTYDS